MAGHNVAGLHPRRGVRYAFRCDMAVSNNRYSRRLVCLIGFALHACVPRLDAAPVECGAPAFDASREAALFIWKACAGDGAWHVRVTGGGRAGSTWFTGSLISTGDFSAVSGFRLEPADTLDDGTPGRLTYRLRVARSGQDGFSFTFPDRAETCFTLDGTAGFPVWVGASRAALPLPISLTTAARCRTETVTVHDTVLGRSTRYIGAVEGDVDFDSAHFQDLGINAYRIYGGMSRWEAEDDDGVYGYPSISQIKANPDVINWEWWDNVMTNPIQGSDYWWSGEAGKVWRGNARRIFRTLRQTGIRPILTLRNVDNGWNPLWAWQLNPPRTQDDRNEWWAHVFATVYWLNVRNNYHVDDFEIHNEPDNPDQGWAGTQADYFAFARLTQDAIDHVYRTYLPRRSYRLHAPKTVGGSVWPLAALQQIPNVFDVVNVHNYHADISGYVRRVHGWMNGTPHRNSPLWLGEWGTYRNRYDNPSLALRVIANLIRGSRPGDDYVYGSTIFSLYDWGDALQGLIGRNDQKRLAYYALRMGIRALQGGRTTLSTTHSDAELEAIATRTGHRLYLLMVNVGTQPYALHANVRTFALRGRAVIREFRERVKDRRVDAIDFTGGHIPLWMPAKAAVLVRVNPDDG